MMKNNYVVSLPTPKKRESFVLETWERFSDVQGDVGMVVLTNRPGVDHSEHRGLVTAQSLQRPAKPSEQDR